ncbi:Cox15p LALA0_S07e01750g [Lachancea lanzarotensis]|uniref:LALA0S07e01750g1_1 n=1 Tax=Lachancea lanzarotensis TaxID=1245769 RepID=A0A0C7MSY6_9SACH|nr:uncharacterized protein LALA0_S07e01750g [Lachancea lanzarotensis]CEP63071.1 LALA0S07e01750g1_1 [Lachancea lanzarotensis]
MLKHFLKAASPLARSGARIAVPHFPRSAMGTGPLTLKNITGISCTQGLKTKLQSPRFFSSSSLLNQVATTVKKQPAKRLINSSKQVGYWLIGTSGLVFGIVVLGGLTRLTESGLSITEWRPVAGTLPPMNEQEWLEEFAKYRESPEFQQLNSHINLEEFKFIYFMEWVHRLWGRAIGAVFVLPAVYFAVARKTSPRVNGRLFALASLLGLQGFIGWWMVKSGLDKEELKERRSKPTVSQYRLTTHLTTAFMLYLGMLWTGMEILKEAKWVKDPKKALVEMAKLDNPALNPLRKTSLGLLALIFATAMSGGMVAGLDAGLIYNTFPHMGDDWIPSKRELFDKTFARKEDSSDLFWRNMLENPATVQLNHRILATASFLGVFAMHMWVNRRKHILPANAVKSMHAMMGVVTLQVTLGMFTLIYLVPISLGSLHQAGAMALLTNALIFAAQLRKARVPMRFLIGGLSVKAPPKAASTILTEAAKAAK